VRKLIAFDDDTFDNAKQLGPYGWRASRSWRRSVSRSAQKARHSRRPERTRCARALRLRRRARQTTPRSRSREEKSEGD